MSEMTNKGILNRNQLLARLQGGQIFRAGTWSEGCLRGASYDLRMASDFMVAPDRPERPSGRFYPKGVSRQRPVILIPGDVAFISTVEKCGIPWDLSGTIGAKFSLTAQGLLILTGLFVDPGYGLVTLNGDDWTAADDQRLHFLVANVGSSDVVLMPGQQKIAAIQFATIDDPITPTHEIQSLGLNSIEEQYINPETAGSAGLVFFRNVAELARRINDFELRFSQTERRIAGIETGSNQVVIFGVFLVCVTLIGVMFQMLVAGATSQSVNSTIQALNTLLANFWPGTIFGFIIIVFACLGVLSLIKLLFRFISRP